MVSGKYFCGEAPLTWRKSTPDSAATSRKRTTGPGRAALLFAGAQEPRDRAATTATAAARKALDTEGHRFNRWTQMKPGRARAASGSDTSIRLLLFCWYGAGPSGSKSVRSLIFCRFLRHYGKVCGLAE